MAMELNRLFRTLELKTGNPEEKIEGYLIAVQGASHHALQTTIARIIRGEIDSFSKKFCPTPPELAAAIRLEMQFVDRQIAIAAERLKIADNRPQAAQHLTIADRQADAHRRMADENRAFLFSVGSHAELLSRRREIPAGGTYTAITGQVWGPPGSAAVAVGEPVAADDDIHW
ncbi:hypothetical protein MRS76_11340 [Rhizobiaceae bacterium n13]|uniref:hypothetical protein n=1 Tax=Ferirhizobium litorale TaxID=2927786 RepID=UPI0024B2A63F|nr:hypothetical protein [Fererhizobium litorale]MDI7862555.1 hypothetical protein [Fererhizobium litorale]